MLMLQSLLLLFTLSPLSPLFYVLIIIPKDLLSTITNKALQLSMYHNMSIPKVIKCQTHCNLSFTLEWIGFFHVNFARGVLISAEYVIRLIFPRL
jgi:hypothetical protein